MAGQGSRFAKVGYKKPKPFITVKGKMMIVRVLENLSIDKSRLILLARKEHIDDFASDFDLIKKKFDVKVLPIFELTEGSACTVLKAEKIINSDEPLIIANSDQIIDINFNDFVNDAFARYLDGSIITFKNFEKNPKWSFAKVDNKLYVTEVREKEAISNNATAGVYFFKKGSFFINGTLDMMNRKDKVNGEYYTCPVYNYLVKKSLRIGIYEILEKQMHGIGTPEDLKLYLNKIL